MPGSDWSDRLKLRFSILLVALSVCHLSFAAQTATPVATNQDADKKNPAAAKTSKKEQKKDEKKEEPKQEEKKGGMTADTFSGLKFRLIGPAVAS